MSEPVSALSGASFSGVVAIKDIGPRGMITLRGDLASPVIKETATGITGVDFPELGRGNSVGDKGILWMSPDEVLVLTQYADAADAIDVMSKTLAGEHHLLANVSDARAMIEVRGSDKVVREVLAKLTPADLHPEKFLPGHFRRTRLAQVPAAILLREEGVFDVFCFSSVAQYVFDLLSKAAEPGSEVGFH